MEIELRRKVLSELWEARHPGMEMEESDKEMMEALINLGLEYDKVYKDQELEDAYNRRSNELRDMLGIRVLDDKDISFDRKRASIIKAGVDIKALMYKDYDYVIQQLNAQRIY